jgi:5-methylcytosine-specific restriction endonuclease McrA
MFTSKVDVDTVRRCEQQKAEYLAYSREISRIKDALQLLAEVRSESREYASRMSQIEGRLALAEEKRGAIERFEAKHGKAFAKAAAVDNQTRSRATSLKRLVKKTKDCPYCGGDLGIDPHLDHIYPVSKGGLSIVENLVWCCCACNAVKADKGLMQFLKERSLSIERTLSQLHSLGKHV